MNFIYELFISDKISYEQVAEIVSNYTNIDYEKIGTMDECINKFGTIEELTIAVDVYFYSRGYKTYVNINQLGFRFKESQIIKLACELAISLRRNIALADEVDCGEFNYIIISPDKKYQKAYRIVSNEDAIEFTTYSEKADINEYIYRLDDE